MPALITSAIPQSNFEKIRDAIAAVLALELPNQTVLVPAFPAIKKVYTERCIGINSETECPCVNVCIAKADYDNRTVIKADGLYTFNVDIYTSSPTSDANGAGDQRAMINMSRIAAVIRSILSNPIYKTLGLPLGIINGLPAVVKFMVVDRAVIPDALSDVVGRLTVVVKSFETVEGQLATGVPLLINTTTTLLEDDKGFYYETTF